MSSLPVEEGEVVEVDTQSDIEANKECSTNDESSVQIANADIEKDGKSEKSSSQCEDAAPDPAEAGLFSVGPIKWINNLTNLHGPGLIFMLFCTQHVMKGFCKTLTGESSFFLFQDMHVPASKLQVYDGIIGLPWTIKPAFALFSDIFPIFGYHKNPYMTFSIVVGLIGATVSGVYMATNAVVLVVSLFGIECTFSVCDLLTEAQYSSRIRKNPRGGPNLLSFVWLGINFFSLVGLGCSGLILAYSNPHVSYLVILIPFVLCMVPTVSNALGEEKVSSEAAREKRLEIWMRHRPLMFLCILVLALSVGLFLTGILVEDKVGNLIAASVTLVVLGTSYAVVLRPMIAKAMVFYLIQATCYLRVGSATMYFYTDSEEAYPEGPHFSRPFVTVGLGSIALVCSIVALLCYNKWMRKWKYRSLLIWTNLIQCFLASIDVIFFLRLNVKWGIPDLAFVLGTSVFKNVIGAWAWIPGLVMHSHMCPRGLEAILFSLLAGAHNGGATLADYLGSYVLDQLDIHPQNLPNESEEFENLWIAALISALLPIITLFLIPICLPDAKQTEPLLSNTADACAGSLWQRYVVGMPENPQDDDKTNYSK